MDLNKIIIKSINKFHENPSEEMSKLAELKPYDIEKITKLETLIELFLLASSESSMLNIINDFNYDKIADKLSNIKSYLANRISEVLRENNKTFLYEDYDTNPIIDLRTLLNMVKATRAFRYYISWFSVFEFDLVNNIKENIFQTYPFKNSLVYMDFIIMQGCLMDSNMACDLATEKTSIVISIISKTQADLMRECNEILRKENEKSGISEEGFLETDNILYN